MSNSVQQMRAVKAVQVRFERLSAWDFGYAVNLAIAALITYALISSITPLLVNRPAEPVGILWAVISAVFVVKDTREHSLLAGISRLVSTCVSFALCLVYLLFLPANPLGMAILIVIGTLLIMLAGRRDEINLVAITTAVILIVATGKIRRRLGNSRCCVLQIRPLALRLALRANGLRRFYFSASVDKKCADYERWLTMSVAIVDVAKA